MKALARCTSEPGRYKIVEVKDLNDKAYYELWFHKPKWWKNDRWVKEYTTTNKGNFNTKKEVYDYLRSLVIARKVVKEGRITL